MSSSVLFTDPNQVKMLVESISNEKGLPVEMIFIAMENALACVLKKQIGGEPTVRVLIDRLSGSYDCFKVSSIVADDAEIENADSFMILSDALEKNDSLNIGDELLEPLSLDQGRISAYQAGQMITKFVREAERVKLVEQFERRIGELFSGQVKRVTKDNIIVDLGDRVEACLTRKDILPREIFRIGDRVKAYLNAVDLENKGPVLLLSRTDDNMLIELFKLEVPEMQEGVLEIKAVARDPGVRAKIAVKTKDSRVDAVGACVGMRGARVQAVSSELNGERVDIIIWDENPAKMVISAMSPAEIQSVVIDENEKTMDVIVEEEALSQAIGRGGQNVRLASKLVGWSLNVMSQAGLEQKQSEAPVNVVLELCEALDIDEQLAVILADNNFDSLDAIAESSVDVLAKIEEFDEDIATELFDRAKAGLLEEVILMSGDDKVTQPAEDLLQLKGMPKLVAYRLAASGIAKAEDLADLSILELKHIKGLNESLSAEIIMAARKFAWKDQG